MLQGNNRLLNCTSLLETPQKAFVYSWEAQQAGKLHYGKPNQLLISNGGWGLVGGLGATKPYVDGWWYSEGDPRMQCRLLVFSVSSRRQYTVHGLHESIWISVALLKTPLTGNMVGFFLVPSSSKRWHFSSSNSVSQFFVLFSLGRVAVVLFCFCMFFS